MTQTNNADDYKLAEIANNLLNGNNSDARDQIIVYGVTSFPRAYLNYLQGTRFLDAVNIIIEMRRALIQLSIIEAF